MEGLYMALLTVPSAAAAAVFLADWKAQRAAKQNAAFRNLRDTIMMVCAGNRRGSVYIYLNVHFGAAGHGK